MRLLKYPLLATTFAFLLCLLSMPLKLSAASTTGSSLTTSPVSQNLVIAPGTSATTTLQVQNNSTQAENISVKLEEFTANGDSGQAQIIHPPAGDDSLSWVSFSPSTFTAQPGVWNKVVMTINLPKTAAFGYYYAALFVPTSSVSASGSDLTKFKGANAIFVLVDTKSAGEKRQLAIQSFTADKTVTDFLPVTFSVKIKNTGNIFVVPRGYVYVSRNASGSAIDALDINAAAGSILPGTSRTFNVAWSNGFPFYQVKRNNGQIVSDNNGKPQMELNWNFNQVTRLRIGQYYGRLALVYNDGTRDIESTTALSFWVVPWLLIGVGLVIALFVGVGLWSSIRKIINMVRSLGRRR